MEKSYRRSNLMALPLWLLMIMAPNHRWTQRASRSSSVYIIVAANYLLTLIRSAQSEGGQMPDFSSLESVRQGLSTPAGALAAWTHVVTLDLFTGAWIYRQALRLNAPRWVRVPALAFTLVSGPIGLLIFLLWRWLGADKGEALAGFDMGPSRAR